MVSFSKVREDPTRQASTPGGISNPLLLMVFQVTLCLTSVPLGWNLNLMDHAALVRVIEPATDLGHDSDFVLEPLGLVVLHHLREAGTVE